jgi:transcriptional regulator with XRE-family HTH domain
MGRPPGSDVDRFVGYRIKELRLLAGMTQQQVGGQLGLSNHHVHRLEKGLNLVSAGRLLAIARVFDVAVGDLFDGYDRGAPLGPPLDPTTSRMLLDVTHSFLELEPKYQDAFIRLARAMAADG